MITVTVASRCSKRFFIPTTATKFQFGTIANVLCRYTSQYRAFASQNPLQLLDAAHESTKCVSLNKSDLPVRALLSRVTNRHGINQCCSFESQNLMTRSNVFQKRFLMINSVKNNVEISLNLPCSNAIFNKGKRFFSRSSDKYHSQTKEKIDEVPEKSDTGSHESNFTSERYTTQGISPPSLVDKLPLSIQPYARLARVDKPIGTALLLWPCFWSTAIAAPPGCFPDPTLLGLFSVGAFVMRGAGCTINDMWDAEFDRSVERTKDRPLASGQLNMTQATAFLAAQLTAGLAVLLSLPHTEYCFKLGAASLPLVATYPLMKRFTNWPQLVLGLTFNWGAFMGWAAVHGDIGVSCVLPLYFSGVCWTLVYDTLYAHQDKTDDHKLGLKSTALHFGENTKPILHSFSALTLIFWTMTGVGVEFTGPIYYIGTGLAWSHLTWQIHTADLDKPENLAERFRSNQYLGAIMFGSCVAGNMTMV